MRKVFGAKGVADRTARLVRAGVLRPATAKLSPELLEPSPVKDAAGKVLQALLGERRKGR